MKRASGVLMHVSSLWGRYSSGSFGDAAREFIDFIEMCGFSYWQTLPFCLPDNFGSPYSSYSSFSVNPNFIDLPTLFQKGLLTKDELAGAEQSTDFSCEFERLSENRGNLLRAAAERFGNEKEIGDFMKLHPHTENFCVFMARLSANGNKKWQEWTEDEYDEGVLKTWRFICFEFFREWSGIKKYANSRGIKIIGDIPIYVAENSSDVMGNPELFVLDKRYMPKAVAGVPPDDFCIDGQLWGTPLYNWEKMKSDGFKWWRERMEFMCELFDSVRIDHFRGIESYYSVPAGENTARHGKWLKGPGMDLIIELKKAAGERLLIAENLGFLTKATEELLNESGFPGMRVLQFAFTGERDSSHLPYNYENNCVAYTGTHDNNTLLGYVWELDADRRRELFDYCGFTGEMWDSREAYFSVIRTMLESSAGIVIFPAQDLLFYGSNTRFNTPGNPYDNWRWRVSREAFCSIDHKRLRRYNELYGRI